MPDFACRFPQACRKTCTNGTDRSLAGATSALDDDTRPRRPLLITSFLRRQEASALAPQEHEAAGFLPPQE